MLLPGVGGETRKVQAGRSPGVCWACGSKECLKSSLNLLGLMYFALRGVEIGLSDPGRANGRGGQLWLAEPWQVDNLCSAAIAASDD